MSATGDALVDLVHGLADQAEFHHRAVFRDEPRVRRSARGRKFRPAPGLGLDRLGRQLGEGAGLGDEGKGVAGIEGQFEFFRRPRTSSRRRISALRLSGVQWSLKRTLNRTRASPGMTLVAALPMSMEVISRLEASNQSRARVERCRHQRAHSASSMRNGIVGALRIGDMALLAAHESAGR